MKNKLLAIILVSSISLSILLSDITVFATSGSESISIIREDEKIENIEAIEETLIPEMQMPYAPKVEDNQILIYN